MATYVLVPGAGGDAGYWRYVEPVLRARGHDVVAVDLPGYDDSAGLTEYVDITVKAIGDRRDLIVVGQSLGAFTASAVCGRVPVDLLVLVAPMIPRPGESAGEWWANTGSAEARRASDEALGRSGDEPFDFLFTFFHDVDPERTRELMSGPERPEADRVFQDPWPLAAWPDVPTRVLICQDDRFFPAAFQRRVVEDRLGITPDELPGGHLPAFSRPHDLVERLEAYRLPA
jgi:pimeloyl-ACP methyl ester carboxylesterase